MNRIAECLMEITKLTVPSGAEEDFARKYLFDMETDDIGNRFVSVGESNTAFCAHLDDVSRDVSNVVQAFDGRFLRSDGNTILGADDKCGVALLLQMIKERKPGKFLFFVQEETGHHGSIYFRQHSMDFLAGVDKIVAFDRKGYSSVVVRQGSITASTEFATQLLWSLGGQGLYFYQDDTGISSDTVSFMDAIQECVNISSGYFKAHSPIEYCDTLFLEHLARAATAIDFDSLRAYRQPAKRLGT